MVETIRSATSPGSRDCEMIRPTSAKLSAARRRRSASAKSRAFSIAMPACSARLVASASASWPNRWPRSR